MRRRSLILPALAASILALAALAPASARARSLPCSREAYPGNGSEVIVQSPAQRWMGGVPVCGALETGPSGSYDVLCLRDNGDGAYVPSSPLTVGIRPAPSGPEHERLPARLAPGAPSAGSAGLAVREESHSWLARASLAGLVLAAPSFAAATVLVAVRRGARQRA